MSRILVELNNEVLKTIQYYDWKDYADFLSDNIIDALQAISDGEEYDPEDVLSKFSNEELKAELQKREELAEEARQSRIYTLEHNMDVIQSELKILRQGEKDE